MVTEHDKCFDAQTARTVKAEEGRTVGKGGERRRRESVGH